MSTQGKELLMASLRGSLTVMISTSIFVLAVGAALSFLRKGWSFLDVTSEIWNEIVLLQVFLVAVVGPLGGIVVSKINKRLRRGRPMEK